MLHKINKLNVFNISIISALWLSIKTVHDKYNQSFGGERGGEGDVRGFQNEERHFGGIFKTPGQSPQTKLLIYTTSSKPSKKSLLKNEQRKEKKKKNEQRKKKPFTTTTREGKKTKQNNKMADLKKFTTTLTQLHFSSHKNRSFPERK